MKIINSASSKAPISPGFTLIEVMAALAILSIALVVLTRSQTVSLSNVANIKNYERAVFVTENALHWTFLDLNEAESWEEFGNITTEDGDYVCNVTVQQTEMEGEGDTRAVMLKIIATTIWPEGKHEGQFQLETWYLWGQEL